MRPDEHLVAMLGIAQPIIQAPMAGVSTHGSRWGRISASNHSMKALSRRERCRRFG